jgi:hypothetical protein
MNELATDSKNKNIRDLYRGINGDLLADSHNILNLWKNYYSR